MKFGQRADQVLLAASRMGLGVAEVEPVVNLGGFSNQNFSLRGKGGRYHVKLATDGDGVSCLRQWWELQDLLAGHYRAPKVVSWIDCGPEAAGLVFEHLEGDAAQLDLGRPPRHEVAALLKQLHSDLSLAQRWKVERSCLEFFQETFEQRLSEDLALITQAPPPFVNQDELRWMQGELEALCRAVQAEPLFARPADRPIHGDPWQNNVLVGATDWWMLDWDDLQLGDPALDLAILGVQDPAMERLDYYHWACRLDAVIDVLADWVEAHCLEGELQQPFRALKEQSYRRGREGYFRATEQ